MILYQYGVSNNYISIDNTDIDHTVIHENTPNMFI